MAAIGELFKTLGKNEIFTKYCNEMQNGKSNNDIADLAFNDDDLMSILRGIIQDDAIIRNKMETIIGQKRKGLEKKEQEVKKNIITDTVISVNNKDDEKQNSECEDNDEDNYDFQFKPLFPEKASWLNKYSFVEQIDHRMRLVDRDMELFY